jgi:hypothetical protein
MQADHYTTNAVMKAWTDLKSKDLFFLIFVPRLGKTKDYKIGI